ncbi:MAG: ATP-dependent DNA helicase DinG [Gammaproteobacteria bacterium]|uniref:ATP-dependent DNA helicase DinG n=1 Tax=Hydrogenophaga sp. TaxID=1904254 RepID=UPI0025B8CEC1|nr:ATP-dependent DNA helicase DinG [Hydrogenophaga sp.]MBU4182190.1 ATP-dependent DNA helicase DinG [Gammaproteobacteria bacterium]MBU4282092.1 ATP-dependent DNA helicase DinG [Gammaproteobacteria bacterium]MBU4321576.1 ATP-dependent DNA helicase DinG [Gammaproteobacteria bacterium]MCG2655645.1 ATP-dependent DNA helicase DinG [Hydrogenophaga sp.]
MSTPTDTPDVSAADAGALPTGPLAREALALAAFDHVVSHAPGFRSRPGQREMAALIAHTLSGVSLGDGSVSGEAGLPERGIAVVQAGTGVGKSAAYVSTVIPLALAQQKRVVISTATVALQEQLIAKDLPALAAALPEPFTYSLAKGRGRYVCRLKLDQLSGGDAASADLFESDDASENTDGSASGIAAHTVASAAASARAAERWGERAKVYTQWTMQLDSGAWDGDRDRLDEPPEGELWSPVAAERHSCTARHCPSYNSCSYYQARAKLAQSQVIVVNHDLLLSTLGLHALPAPEDCYLVFDEAHHLGAVAQGQFSESMDLMRSQWLDRLPRAVDEVAGALQHTPGVDVALLAREMKGAQGELARLAMARIGALPAWAALTGRAPRSTPARGGFDAAGAPVVERFEGGALPPEWMESVSLLHSRASALLKVMEALATQLKANARDNPGDAARCARLYSRLGVLAPRLQHAQATAELWLQDPAAGQPPLAKWLEAGIQHGLVTLTAHACPLQPGSLLRHQLWSKVRAAVVTSASLVTCGGFDHFLHESGLAFDDAVVAREVQSPFDHARQGRLVVVQTQADPKDVEGYSREMLDALMDDLAGVQRGALVLFTSKALMRRAQELLERGLHRELRDKVLAQGEASRTQLLRQHAERVQAGGPSILFGLQSFGEGLDLPGELCEWVFITKLPFASPSDPVGQARADWLKAQGRDPFSELVVPATGARLLQWTGRALRSETDEAVVVCYDARLLRQSYGRRMLKGLPPYKLQRRVGGVLTDVSA